MNKTNPAAGNGIIPAGDNHKLSKNVKLEVSDDTVTMDDIKMEGDVDVESSQEPDTTDATPTPTPRKRGRKKAVPTNTATNPTTSAEAEEDENETELENKQTTTPSKKTKTTTRSGATTPKKEISISYESASKEDRMLIRMREVEGKSWAEISTAWEAMTGVKTASGTLCKRYSRLRANLAVFKDEDVERLLQAKKEIEEKFEAEKWTKIAAAIVAKGGDQYPPASCLKKFKELSKGRTATSMQAGNGNGNVNVKVEEYVQEVADDEA
ncbi:hypothetical protein T310_2257 [Rasamsonia emersonii CBS 393.64]|uniref:Myb-like domain-containing protein n=1 Tax=Rasamsonia emersonii (strain ATCC 16479 / CBS 393.64 / IMI 116815) TaxID=1408163 RepID=A0A0F4YZM1_RASE3|nr:hypothetical protein T310_2257 [Rasamsonia emersonii CBS 393.64]KKA23717.1 hypothetical protein T310_2257 [Rasamsonia emersonii CBS 393.64]